MGQPAWWRASLRRSGAEFCWSGLVLRGGLGLVWGWRFCSHLTPICRGRCGGSGRCRRESLRSFRGPGCGRWGSGELSWWPWGLDYRELFEDACDYVVVVGLGDFGSVEGSWDQGFVGAEVVDEDFAVDLGGVEGGAALPEEFGLFGFALDEEVDLAAYPGGFGFGADLLLELHQLAAAGLDGAVGDFEFVC